jgi:glutathione S-transferase
VIDLYTSPTPNGHKVSIALEEMGLDYEFQTIDLRSGEQKREPFLTHSPNGRIPAIYDRDFDLSIFESGAIMMHLAEKSGKFLPTDVGGALASRPVANVSDGRCWTYDGTGECLFSLLPREITAGN